MISLEKLRDIVYTESDCGTHLDGCHGWANSARVVRKAMVHGFKLTPGELAGLEQFENGEQNDATDVVNEQGGLADRATEFLGEITTAGLVWVWDMGELTLMSETDADEFGHFG